MTKTTLQQIWESCLEKKSIKSYINFLISNYEKSRASSKIRSKPYLLFIDPTSFCNLRCPFCETGMQTNTREKSQLSIENFIHMVDHIGEYLFEISFFNWGEPLLNRNLPKMIHHAKKYHIFTKVSTNLSVPITESFAKELVESKLDLMFCSIDGATQENYEKYRVGGNLELVIKNLELIIKTKNELQSLTPHLVWRFLVFKHNEHEIDLAKQIAKRLGIPITFGKPFLRDFTSPENWISTMPEYSDDLIIRCDQNNSSQSDKVINQTNKTQYNKPCSWLWSALTISSNGSSSPCCGVNSESYDFGKSFDVKETWNNKKYQEARSFFNTKKTNPSIICTWCPCPDVQGSLDVINRGIVRFMLTRSPIWIKPFLSSFLKKSVPI